jgi:hypothetical protein
MTTAGHGSRRTMAIAMAWGWGRLQPQSTCTPWEQARCGQGRARLRNSGMVALARKFLIALWRFLKTGELPAGAVLKVEVSGEPIPERTTVPRRGRTVVGWCGPRVAGHGCAARTADEEGWSPPGCTGAQSAGRIGCVPPRGYHGEQGVWGQRAPRLTKPPAQVGGHAPVGPSPGTSMARGAEGNTKGLTSTATEKAPGCQETNSP